MRKKGFLIVFGFLVFVFLFGISNQSVNAQCPGSCMTISSCNSPRTILSEGNNFCNNQISGTVCCIMANCPASCVPTCAPANQFPAGDNYCGSADLCCFTRCPGTCTPSTACNSSNHFSQGDSFCPGEICCLFLQPTPPSSYYLPSYLDAAITGWVGSFRFANSNLGEVIGYLLPFVFIAAGIALFIYLLIGGFKLLTSVGNQEGVARARAMLTNAIVGFLIVISCYWLLQIIKIVFRIPD